MADEDVMSALFKEGAAAPPALEEAALKNEPATVPTVVPSRGNVVELRNINFITKSGTTIIHNLNLSIERSPTQGQIISLMGRSGCGKSTILNYLAGLLKPTSGEIFVNGEPHTGHIPMVFQSYSSFPWLSVMDNVLEPIVIQKGKPSKEDRDRAAEILELMNLTEHAQKYALDTQLSGGQLQRVAIARSLIKDSCVLLMDEPFGALDIYTRFRMQMFLLGVVEKLKNTIIFVTHDVEEAVFLGNSIYIMDANPGRIVQHFPIDLPAHRSREIKRDPHFVKLKQDVDDAMFAINNK